MSAEGDARYVLAFGRRARLKKLVDGRIAEDQLLNDVLRRVKQYNKAMSGRGGPWVLAYHTHRSDRSQPGYPDLHLASDGASMLRELKADGKTPEPEQVQWLDMLERAGQDVGVWTPADVVSGRVGRELVALVAAGQRWRRNHGTTWVRTWH